MASLLYYTVLKYIPSAIRMESINIGIAVHYPSQEYSHFFRTKNMRRVRAFDDEYNSNFFNMVIKTLKYELDYGKLFDVSTLDLRLKDKPKRFKNIKDKYFLEAKTSYLTNEFRFSPIQSLFTNDSNVLEDIRDLKDMYLYYDKPKNKRITREKVHSLLSKQLKSYNLVNVKKEPVFKDNLGGEVKFDYKINDNTLLKTITFDYSKLNNLSKELKVILYDLNEVNYSNISSIFLIRNDNIEDKTYKEIYDKFKEEVKLTQKKRKNKILVFPLCELSQTLNKESKLLS